MNKFFINTTKKLNLKSFKSSSDTDINQITPVLHQFLKTMQLSERFKSVSQTLKQMTLILDRYL